METLISKVDPTLKLEHWILEKVTLWQLDQMGQHNMSLLNTLSTKMVVSWTLLLLQPTEQKSPLMEKFIISWSEQLWIQSFIKIRELASYPKCLISFSFSFIIILLIVLSFYIFFYYLVETFCSDLSFKWLKFIF